MIDQGNLKKRSGLTQSPRQAPVRLTRLRITGWVVMGDGDRIGPGGNGRSENLPWMGDTLIEATFRNLPDIQQPMARIE